MAVMVAVSGAVGLLISDWCDVSKAITKTELPTAQHQSKSKLDEWTERHMEGQMDKHTDKTTI